MDTIYDFIFDEICDEAFPLLDEYKQEEDCLVKGTTFLNSNVVVPLIMDDLNINKDMAYRVFEAYPLNKRS
tara:strand:- start:99 stop:311 length:213 start_codon:yes stop_codon:yes gene_type:complete